MIFQFFSRTNETSSPPPTNESRDDVNDLDLYDALTLPHLSQSASSQLRTFCQTVGNEHRKLLLFHYFIHQNVRKCLPSDYLVMHCLLLLPSMKTKERLDATFKQWARCFQWADWQMGTFEGLAKDFLAIEWMVSKQVKRYCQAMLTTYSTTQPEGVALHGTLQLENEWCLAFDKACIAYQSAKPEDLRTTCQGEYQGIWSSLDGFSKYISKIPLKENDQKVATTYLTQYINAHKLLVLTLENIHFDIYKKELDALQRLESEYSSIDSSYSPHRIPGV